MSEKHYTEWPQEEKDELARQRMEAMAKKNEELKKRHAEVEADRRNAELLNSSVNTLKVKRGSSSEDPDEKFIGNSGRMKSTSGSNADSHRKFQSEFEGNRSKQYMARKGPQPKMSMTKQKLYEEWKAERQQIDDDRNARQKDSVGSYRREWDKDKLEAEPEKQNTSLHYYKIPKWASNDEYQKNNRENYRGHDRGMHYKNRNQSFGPKYDGENTYEREKKERFDEKSKGKPFRKGESSNSWSDNEDSSCFGQQKFNNRGSVFQKDGFVKRGPANHRGTFRSAQRDYNTGYLHADSDCQRKSKDATFGFASSENTNFSSRCKGSFTSKNVASKSIERKHTTLSSGWSDGEDEISPIQKTKPKSFKKCAGVTDSSGTWSDTESDFDNCHASNEKHVRNIYDDSTNWADSENSEFCELGHSQHKGHASELITRNSDPCKSYIHNSQNPVVDSGNTDNRGDKPIPPPLDPSVYRDRNPKNDSYHMRNDRRNRVFNNSVSETNCDLVYDSSQFQGRFLSHTHEASDSNQESRLRGKGSCFTSSNFSSSRNRPEYLHKEFDDRHNHGSHRGRGGRGKNFQDKGSFQRPFLRELEDFDYQKNKGNSQNINRGGRHNFQQRVKENLSDKRFNGRPNLRNQGLRVEESHASKDGNYFKKNSDSKILDSEGIWGETNSSENDENWGNTENAAKDDLILKFPEDINEIEDSTYVCKDNKNSILQEEIRKEDYLWKENEGNSIQQALDDNLADTENVGYLNCESSAACNLSVNIEKKGTSQCEVEQFIENDVACSESHDGSWTTISGADSVNEQIEEEYIDIDGHEYQYSSYLRESADDRLISTCEIQDVISESNKNEITELHSCDKPNEQTAPNSCDNVILKDLCRDINVDHTSSSISDSCMNTSSEPSGLSCDHIERSCSKFHGIALLSSETNLEFRSSGTEVDNETQVHESIKSCDIICDAAHVFSGTELEIKFAEVLKKSDLLLNMEENIDVEENCCQSSTADESIELKTQMCAQNIDHDDHCSDSKELNVIKPPITVIDKDINISLSSSAIEDGIIDEINVESEIESSVNAEEKKCNLSYLEMEKEILLESIDSINTVDCHSLHVKLVDSSLAKKSALKDDDYSHLDDPLNAKCHLESNQSVSLDGKEMLKCKANQNGANCLDDNTEMSSVSAYNENTEELINSASEKKIGLNKVVCNHPELDIKSSEFTEVSVLHTAVDVEFPSQLSEKNEEKQECDAISEESECCSSGIDTQKELSSKLKLSVEDHMTVYESISYHESAQNVSPNEISVQKVSDDSVKVLENFDCFQ